MAITSVSDNCVELVKLFEGCKLTAYKDVVGVWTIGYGTTSAAKSITGTTIKQGLKITQATADDWLKKTLNKSCLPNIMKYDKIYNWNQNQVDALACFAYNIGSIDSLVNKGKRSLEEVSNSFGLYNKAKGKVLKGLTKRRAAEKKLFDTPVATKKATTTKTTATATTTTTSAKSITIPSGDPVLKVGSTGNNVTLLQGVLNRIMKAELKADGDFGNNTCNAVKSLQNLIKVTSDGEYGTKTAKALKEYLTKKEYSVKIK